MSATAAGRVITSVLAHQGGRDEIALVLLPIALFAGLLALANRRAGRQQAEAEAEGDRVSEPDSPDE